MTWSPEVAAGMKGEVWKRSCTGLRHAHQDFKGLQEKMGMRGFEVKSPTSTTVTTETLGTDTLEEAGSNARRSDALITKSSTLYESKSDPFHVAQSLHQPGRPPRRQPWPPKHLLGRHLAPRR